jgi:tetratricopeptide (TPR) repeat protein
MGDRELPWDYYYLKAKIYESLGFYEQSLAIYRVAFLKAKTEKERIKTTVGIIRTAVWVRRPDVVEEYYILISTAKLSPEEEREVEFVRGLMLFSQGKYKRALPHFLKVYRKYESYLIDNPEYYFLVAENIYRIGKLTLAERLFRRIVSLTKSKEVIRKSVLRLGDIELKKGNKELAFVYYYSVIRDAPKSQEAEVARLKIIPMMKDPKIKYRTSLTDDEAFKDPIKYIARLLVNYRTTYVGIYALADLGYLIFSIGAPETTFERLLWEVSLVFPEQVKYEQGEFLRLLWTPYLLELPSDKLCKLYRSNARFFKEIFTREVLLRIAGALKSCNMRRLRIDLLKFMVKKWNSDSDIILMAQALYDNKDFLDAYAVLKRVRNKKLCGYQKLLFKLGIFLEKGVPSNLKILKNSCAKEKSPELPAIFIYYLVKNGKLEESFRLFDKNREMLREAYNSIPVVKAALSSLMEKAVVEERYDKAYAVSRELVDSGYLDCYTGSILVISGVRLGKLNEVSDVVEKLKGCRDRISRLAKTVYSDAKLEEVLRGGADF